VQGFRAIEIDGVLVWIAVPQFMLAPLVATLQRYIRAAVSAGPRVRACPSRGRNAWLRWFHRPSSPVAQPHMRHLHGHGHAVDQNDFVLV
jgi:hypothetical protein